MYMKLKIKFLLSHKSFFAYDVSEKLQAIFVRGKGGRYLLIILVQLMKEPYVVCILQFGEGRVK